MQHDEQRSEGVLEDTLRAKISHIATKTLASFAGYLEECRLVANFEGKQVQRHLALKISLVRRV